MGGLGGRYYGLLDVDLVAQLAIYSVVYALEVVLLAWLIRRGHWKRLRAVCLYLGSLIAIDGVARSAVLHRYGFTSSEYAYFFWLTDVGLVLAAFGLVCAFFRRAALGNDVLWRHLRVMLPAVFILIVGLSTASVLKNYDNLFTIFIVELQQNLYFTCLVLNTLLYILMQQIDSADEELGLLVCGLGIQFAGPAASLALRYLTPAAGYSTSLVAFVPPLCTLGMLLIWFYGLMLGPKTVVAVASARPASSREGVLPREA